MVQYFVVGLVCGAVTAKNVSSNRWPLLEAIIRPLCNQFNHDLIDTRRTWAAACPGDDGGYNCGCAHHYGLDTAIVTVAHPAADAETRGLLRHAKTIADALHPANDDQMARFHVRHPYALQPAYLTRMPGWAPLSGESRNSPGLLPSVSEAASTMPSDMPNFILRGARLATITVRRPTNAAGS